MCTVGVGKKRRRKKRTSRACSRVRTTRGGGGGGRTTGSTTPTSGSVAVVTHVASSWPSASKTELASGLCVRELCVLAAGGGASCELCSSLFFLAAAATAVSESCRTMMPEERFIPTDGAPPGLLAAAVGGASTGAEDRSPDVRLLAADSGLRGDDDDDVDVEWSACLPVVGVEVVVIAFASRAASAARLFVGEEPAFIVKINKKKEKWYCASDESPVVVSKGGINKCRAKRQEVKTVDDETTPKARHNAEPRRLTTRRVCDCQLWTTPKKESCNVLPRVSGIPTKCKTRIVCSSRGGGRDVMRLKSVSNV